MKEKTASFIAPFHFISKIPSFVFAESEIISLRARGFKKEDIAAGLIENIARRVAVMVRQVGLKQNVAFVGGVAKKPGIKVFLEKELGIPLYVPTEPQITRAIGAALYGISKR